MFGDLDALRYVDGRLEPERKAAFLAHLADDPAEAERVALWERQNETLRAAFAGIALESVPPALRLGNVLPARPVRDPRAPIVLRPPSARPGAAAAAEPISAVARARPGRRRDIRLPVTAAVLFGLALLIVYVTHGLMTPPSSWSSDPVALPPALPRVTLPSRAADAFATFGLDSVRPVEVPAAQIGQMAAWTRRRLGIAIPAPGLSAEGWTLLGGRLVPGLDAPAAFFVYEDRGGDRLGLLVTRASPGAAVSLAASGVGVATMAWSAGPLAYAIVTDRSVDWLSRNGEALRERVGTTAAD